MSSASKDNTTPYKNWTPHRRGGPARQVTKQELGTWTIRDMGDTADNNKTITASSLAEALLIYAAAKWDRKAAFLLPVYVKIVGERYIRCVHPEGQIEIMGW
jgi:hypothetical protein